LIGKEDLAGKRIYLLDGTNSPKGSGSISNLPLWVNLIVWIKDLKISPTSYNISNKCDCIKKERACLSLN
jgi:hypothetical protein